MLGYELRLMVGWQQTSAISAMVQNLSCIVAGMVGAKVEPKTPEGMNPYASVGGNAQGGRGTPLRRSNIKQFGEALVQASKIGI